MQAAGANLSLGQHASAIVRERGLKGCLEKVVTAHANTGAWHVSIRCRSVLNERVETPYYDISRSIEACCRTQWKICYMLHGSPARPTERPLKIDKAPSVRIIRTRVAKKEGANFSAPALT